MRLPEPPRGGSRPVSVDHRGGALVTLAAHLFDITVVVLPHLMDQVPEESRRLPLPGGLFLSQARLPLLEDLRLLYEELRRAVERVGGVPEGHEVDCVRVGHRGAVVLDVPGRVAVAGTEQGIESGPWAADVVAQRADVPVDVLDAAAELAAEPGLPGVGQPALAVRVVRHADEDDPYPVHLPDRVRAVAVLRAVEHDVEVLTGAHMPAHVPAAHRSHGESVELYPEQRNAVRALERVEQGLADRHREARQQVDGLTPVVVGVGGVGHGEALRGAGRTGPAGSGTGVSRTAPLARFAQVVFDIAEGVEQLLTVD